MKMLGLLLTCLALNSVNVAAGAKSAEEAARKPAAEKKTIFDESTTIENTNDYNSVTRIVDRKNKVVCYQMNARISCVFVPHL